MKPLVSILVPAFNSEEWIADTLESAVAQTWNPKEIIVVDDGSTDRTLAVAQRFERRGVRVVSQKNQGAAAARNTALALSRGDYVQWLDADDLLAPDKVEKQLERHVPGQKTLLSSAYGRFFYRPSRAKFLPTALWCDLAPAEWLLRKMDLNLFMQTSTWLVPRELSDGVGPWDTRLVVDDDGEYFCRVLLASDGVRFVPDAKVYYRVSGHTSVSYVGQSQRKLDAQWVSMQLHIQYLRSVDDSDRARDACAHYLEHWLPYFYPDRQDVIDQAGALAQSLGRRLRPPRVSWKYSVLAALLGSRLATPTQHAVRRVRSSIARAWDRALAHAERGRRADPSRL